MSAETPNIVLRQVLTALDQGDWTIFDTHPGLYETRQHLPHMRAAFPDLHHTIEVELVEGGRIAPTGKKVSFMLLMLDRIVDGKIVQQLGASIQPPEPAHNIPEP